MLNLTSQRYTETSNGMGGSTQTWTEHLSFEGVIDFMSGNEQKQAEQIGVVANHILLVFEIIDIKENDRIYYNEKMYDVKFVDNPMNMDQHLEILLEYKGVNQDGI
jgi:SPP1 family predicted phage head-tail adaptor